MISYWNCCCCKLGLRKRLDLRSMFSLIISLLMDSQKKVRLFIQNMSLIDVWTRLSYQWLVACSYSTNLRLQPPQVQIGLWTFWILCLRPCTAFHGTGCDRTVTQPSLLCAGEASICRVVQGVLWPVFPDRANDHIPTRSRRTTPAKQITSSGNWLCWINYYHA